MCIEYLPMRDVVFYYTASHTEFEFEWFYALSASKANFGAITYSRITYSVRL